MKRTQMVGLAFVGMLTMSGVAYGYSYDFTNTLRGPVMVRVKHSGIAEPYYYAKLEGKATARLGRSKTFRFEIGSLLALTAEAAMRKVPTLKAAIDKAIKDGQFEYVGRKTGFCLSQISVAPFEWDAKTKKWERTDEFYDLSPHFVKTNYFDKMIQAAGAVAEGSTEIAKKIMKALAQMAAAAA